MVSSRFPIENTRTSIRKLMEETGDKPKPLAKFLGLGETAIRDIFLENTKSVGTQKLTVLADCFGVTIEAILDGSATRTVSSAPPPNAEVVRFEGASSESARQDCPVFGTALGAEMQIDGEAIEQTMLNQGEVIEYRRRPPISNGIEQVYGIYVQGSSMYPAHRDGSFLFAQWDVALRIGDDVVVYLRPNGDDDNGMAARAVLVKRLVRRSAQFVELEQFQPARTFRIAMSDVVRIDRVLTTDDFA